MLETTATYGSVETSDYEKKSLARASLAYNMKSKTFRDLFPDLCQKREPDTDATNHRNGQDGVRRRVPEGNGNTDQENDGGVMRNANNEDQGAGGGGVLNASALSNLLVFIGIIAFVFIAKYVLQSTE